MSGGGLGGGSRNPTPAEDEYESEPPGGDDWMFVWLCTPAVLMLTYLLGACIWHWVTR